MNISTQQLNATSKYLSFILRHKPDEIALNLNEQGWANIDELIEKSAPKQQLTPELIKEVVITNDKQRFKLSDDGKKIRANQGHSIKVDLNLSPSTPPATLFHGTAYRFVKSIESQGLKSMQRQHVHLSCDIETAKTVGRRYGQPVILQIDAKAMSDQGYAFYQSDNGVWLTDVVPVEFITRSQQQ